MDKGASAMRHVAEYVEGSPHVVGRDGIVDRGLCNIGEQGAVDFAMQALFVVAHELEQGIVVVASEAERTIAAVDDLGK